MKLHGLMLTVLLLAIGAWTASIPSGRGKKTLGMLMENKSPHDYGLKESSPQDLPIPDLIESPDKKLDPKPNDLNATELHGKLGLNFDPEFMSISLPSKHKNRPNRIGNDMVDFSYKRNKNGRLVPIGEMPSFVSNMEYNSIHLPNGSQLETRISDRLKKKLQQSIWTFTACPLVYRWKDLGIRFWPRYLKETHCAEGKTSCSIPPGMACRPGHTTYKTLLRWYCKSARRGSKLNQNLLYAILSSNVTVHPTNNSLFNIKGNASSPNENCFWIKADYPVITQCTCTCPTGGNDN